MEWDDTRRTAVDRAVLIVASGFGAGRSRWMPGTVGSLWGPPMVWIWQQAGWPLWSNALLGVALFLVGVPLCTRAAQWMQAKDPGGIVFDEIAAFPFVFLFVEVTWLSAVLGFALFRILDILKPWPCDGLDRLPKGLGIMADDTAAAIFAAFALLGLLQV